MSARYVLWMFEKGLKEMVQILRDWILTKSEFQTTGAEYAHEHQ